jgi:Pregnancy-associated plasma protein-A
MKRKVRLAALVAFVMAGFTGLSVAPASAAHEHAAHDAGLCSALPLKGQNTFGLNAFASGGSAMRGEPGGMANDAAFVAAPKAKKLLPTTIPVHFHVLRAGLSYEEGNISLAKVRKQIDVLNRAFAGGYGGASTPWQFELVSVDYTTNARWFTMGYGTPAEREAKEALHQGGANALNIYTGTAGAYLGWATWPWMQKEHPLWDGIVVDFESLPNGTAERFDLGHTATHEAGHWFGLYHTFQGGCSNSGDGVEDTPRQFVPTRGCPEGQDTCTRHEGLDPIHNYMDYSDDACYSEFSQGQVDRATGFFAQYRA